MKREKKRYIITDESKELPKEVLDDMIEFFGSSIKRKKK